MNEALLKYHRMTLKSSPNAISLLESVAGQLHSGLPNGQTTEPFGQDHLLANPSPLLETKKETTMNATSGQFSSLFNEIEEKWEKWVPNSQMEQILKNAVLRID